jgi:ribonucleoside-diphosphate reductase alpha chain
VYNDFIEDLFAEAGYRIGARDEATDGSKSVSLIILDGQAVVDDHDLTPALSPDKTFDDTSIDSHEHAVGLIDGLIASDGNVNMSSNHPQVRYDTTSSDLAQTFRRACLRIGVHGRITSDDDHTNGTIDGRAIESDSTRYTGHISGRSLRQYIEHSRLSQVHPDKGSAINSLRSRARLTGNTWVATIESIEHAGTDTVYDCYCSGSDTWVTSGYIQQGCAEQPLCEAEACNLGHVNLSLMVESDAPMFDEWVRSQIQTDDRSDLTDVDREDYRALVRGYLDDALRSDRFDETIQTGVRFLDNVVDRSDFPLDDIDAQVSSKRKIGLGLMGFAQMCIQMGVEYGSDVSYVFANEIMRMIDARATRASHDLATERGVFPDWHDSKWADPLDYPDWTRSHGHIDPANCPDGYPMRNHSVTTIAPTGTTSRVADTTGGCEPMYNAVFFKNVSQDIQGDKMLVVFDSYLERVLDANDIDPAQVEEEAVELMYDDSFDSIGDVDVVPESIDRLFTTAEDLDAMEHVRMQAAFQQYCDSGISKTINAPVDATRDDVSDALLYGLQHGVKGTTVYRQGSRDEQVNTTSVTNTQFSADEVEELLSDVEAFVSQHDDGASTITTAMQNATTADADQNGGDN